VYFLYSNPVLKAMNAGITKENYFLPHLSSSFRKMIFWQQYKNIYWNTYYSYIFRTHYA